MNDITSFTIKKLVYGFVINVELAKPKKKLIKLLWQFHYDLNANQKIFYNEKEKQQYTKKWIKRKQTISIK